MYRIFHKNGYFIKLFKDENESIDTFIERGYYIANLQPKNDGELDQYIIYSKIWINNRQYQNMYNTDIQSVVDYYSHSRLAL